MDATTLFEDTLPVSMTPFRPYGRTGLVVIDVVNGFCTPGAGPLAPPAADPAIERMIREIDGLARKMLARDFPLLVMRDSHPAERPEPPYPPHCIKGSGDDELVPGLAWLRGAKGVTVLEKDCIDTYVGGERPDGNAVASWIRDNRLRSLVAVGICTDICVLDAVTSLLSARNHEPVPGGGSALGDLRDVAVYEPGCATYDLPATVAASLGLPPTSAHPRGPTHRLGLYAMQARGALIASEIIL